MGWEAWMCVLFTAVYMSLLNATQQEYLCNIKKDTQKKKKKNAHATLNVLSE